MPNGKMKQIANIMETASHREKRSEIWDSGVLVERIWDNLDLVMFKFVWCNCEF